MSTTATAPPIAPPAPAIAAPPPQRLTADEFFARYASGPYELVKGFLREVPMGGLKHGKICVRIAALIFNHVEANDLGHVMSNDSFVKTGDDTFRGADVLFFSYERLPKGAPVPDKAHDLPPELVIEAKSPSDLWTDVFAKLGEYLRVGVRFLVLVDPSTSTVSIYHGPDQVILGVADTFALPDVLPGFSVPVARLFA